MASHVLRRLLDDNDETWESGFLAESDEVLTDLQVTVYITVSICLILMAGLMSGLTLGLMSLDQVELEVLKRSGTPDEKRYASIIMPVIKNQHFLLVTLLLCNAASTEALPLFIDRLADPVTAVAVSVTSVLVFGEIIPQAICSRYGLKVGAYSAWFVRVLMTLCSPLAWPIGKLLDFLLGNEHSALFRRAQLKALVDVHSSSAGFGGTLSEQEIAVIRGALDLTSKTAAKSMTPLDKVFMLSSEDRLDERTMQAILISGHSRIPVYRSGNRKDIVGLILSKELVLIDPADNLAVSQLKVRPMPRLSADTPMYDMLKLFETGKSHMALLIRGHGRPLITTPKAHQHDGKGKGSGKLNGKKGLLDTQHSTPRYEDDDNASHFNGMTGWDHEEDPEPVGIITIEDVIEELLQEEIIDETDIFVDNLQAQRVNAAEVTEALPPRLQRMLNAGLFTPRVGRLGTPQKFMHPPVMVEDVSNLRRVEVDSAQDMEEVVGADGPLSALHPLATGRKGQQAAHVLIPMVAVGVEGATAGPHRFASEGPDSPSSPRLAQRSVTAGAGGGGPGWLPKLAGRQDGKGRRQAQADAESSQPLLSLNLPLSNNKGR